MKQYKVTLAVWIDDHDLPSALARVAEMAVWDCDGVEFDGASLERHIEMDVNAELDVEDDPRDLPDNVRSLH